MIELVTGYQGKDHITPQQQSDLQRGTFGGNYRLDVGNKMEAYISGNDVIVPDGVIVLYGREFYIANGDTEKVSFDSSNNYICIQYMRNAETYIESCELISMGSNYQDFDLRSEPTLSQIPLCRVVDGEIEMLVEVTPSLNDAVQIVDNVSGDVEQVIAEAKEAVEEAQAAAADAEEAAKAIINDSQLMLRRNDDGTITLLYYTD